jgi:hypothetical protein
LQKYRFVADIKGRIYKSIAGGIILKKEDTKFSLNTDAINKYEETNNSMYNKNSNAKWAVKSISWNS